MDLEVLEGTPDPSMDVPLEDNTKENDGGKGFVASFAALEKVSKLLACSQCATIPAGDDKVYTLGSCFHKYCSSCVEESFSGSKALVCGVCRMISKPGSVVVEDIFSSSVVAGLSRLRAEMIRSKSTSSQVNGATAISAPSVPPRSAVPLSENGAVDPVVAPIPAKRTARSRSAVSNSSSNGAMMTKLGKQSAIESPIVMYKPVPAKRSKSRCLSPDLLDLDENIEDDDPVASTPLPATRGRPKFTPSTIESVESKSTPTSTPTPERTRRSNGRRSNGSSITSVETKSTPTPDRPMSRSSRNRSNGSSIGSADSPAPGNASFTSQSGKVDKKNPKGETPLHVACRMGNLEKATQLVLAGSDPNIQDHAGWTPLHEAINGKGATSCKLDLAKLLVESGSCNPNIPGMDNESAVHEAARLDLKDVIVYLLEHGASPNIRNRVGKLPRDVAATSEIKKILEDTSTSADVSLLEDPVVLEIQLSNAIVYFSYDISPDDLSKVEQILKLKVSKALRGDITHMVFNNESGSEKKVPFSYEYLYGIANGSWILSSDWISKSIEANQVLSPCGFELEGCEDGTTADETEIEATAPKSSRLNRELGNPKLFHGFCFNFYKNSSFGNIGKKNLITLAKLADGQILNREPQPPLIDPMENPTRFHLKQGDNHKLTLTSHIILYDDKNRPPASKMINMEHIKVLKTRWLIESLMDFQLKDSEGYL